AIRHQDQPSFPTRRSSDLCLARRPPASTIRRGSLRNPADAPALFFAPFVSSTMRAEAHWIDYNGHLNAAYYNVFFDRAVDEAFRSEEHTSELQSRENLVCR